VSRAKTRVPSSLRVADEPHNHFIKRWPILEVVTYLGKLGREVASIQQTVKQQAPMLERIEALYLLLHVDENRLNKICRLDIE